MIRHTYAPGDIVKSTQSEIKRADQRLAEMLAIEPAEKNFTNTIEAFETITSDMAQAVTPLTFMNYVNTKKELRAEAEKSEALLSQYFVGLMTRRDLFKAITRAHKNCKKQITAKSEQARLIEDLLKGFKANGLFLPESKLEKMRELKQELASLEISFATNLNESVDFVAMTEKDLAGTPQSFRQRLEKLPGQKYKVTTKQTDYAPFMENASSSIARRRMQKAYENMAARENTKILTKAVKLRKQIASLLGFQSWADYRAQDRMVKNSQTVRKFLASLRGRLSEKNKKDLHDLLQFKKQIDKRAKQIDPWDVAYLSTQMKKTTYAVDDEQIREFFPADRVVDQMFEIYSTLLGLRFSEVKGNDIAWAPGVRLYEIWDSRTSKLIAHFYTDFIPREGKYGHFAAFTLRSGRQLDSDYVTPISAIVGNFNPPTTDKPSLLNHREVETLFHEFGHIMHQTLTRASYAALSGTSVAQDFVEAPSQMFESWVWDRDLLKRISGHYKNPAQKLSDEQIDRLIRLQHFNEGYFYTRQLLFGLFDFELHGKNIPRDVTVAYKKLYKKIVGLKPLSETHFPAGFGHLMGGYDAGYYGYLWSEVYAADMFARFEKEGLLNPKPGLDYRTHILERGDTRPAMELITDFLGRKPNNKAFFQQLGLK